ncbi:hypothetical protein [Shinella sp.]|uniref:hypothetical protein n=1 Tax=Shinella sp. TaxID=1870904 RepID=UPI003F728FCA
MVAADQKAGFVHVHVDPAPTHGFRRAERGKEPVPSIRDHSKVLRTAVAARIHRDQRIRQPVPVEIIGFEDLPQDKVLLGRVGDAIAPPLGRCHQHSAPLALALIRVFDREPNIAPAASAALVINAARANEINAAFMSYPSSGTPVCFSHF